MDTAGAAGLVTVVSTAVTAAVGAAEKLKALLKGNKQPDVQAAIVELRQQLGDAQLRAADLKIELARLKDENDALRRENDALKKKDSGEKPTTYWGCYKFEGDDKLYCIRCYHQRGEKCPVTRLRHDLRRCAVCQSEVGT